MRCNQCGNKIAIDCPKTEDGLCNSCHNENVINTKKIYELMKAGHPRHCACRQVWGDGECECDLYEKGYDPYAWMKLKH